MRAVLAMSALALFWSVPAMADEKQPPQTETTEQARPATEFISQGDPRVRDLPIGKKTVKQVGCLAIAACFAAQIKGEDGEITDCLQMLIANGMFTPSGKMYWAAASLLGVSMHQLYLTGEAAIDEVSRLLSEDVPSLIEVTYRDARGKLRTHWVAASKIVDGVLYVFDSNGGVERMLSEVHGGNVRRVVSVQR